ncbi:hypothetical protein IWW38_006474 [Coemansia aciculifera]|uniref:Uncharacterized protein n=1 Tax=Coemansia aciculifera TaxID=417176 RepID=A0ACC1LSX3_9FUNG|nr:hypothetical protein IWW38_006474 [Coemansia aciculifera]
MADWASTTHDCLDIIERYTDRLDHDLTRPLQVLSTEAASWTPVIARCRKVALALLRHCQANEAVVIQLCSAICTLRQSSARGLDTDCTLHSKAHKSWQHAGDALWRQHSDASAILKKYKKAEQRLSRLHTILLDRQRLRLLSTQRDIHYYFRILIAVSLVFLPLELWYNLDNMNGIATPGNLQPDDSTDEDFWFTVLGMLVWAVAANFLYAVYVKFFEPKPDVLRVVNIGGQRRR